MTVSKGLTDPDPLILAGVQRFARAGFLDGAILAVDGVTYVVSPAYRRLVLAGRNPTEEPGFVVAWMSGDPRAIEAWIESEAALLLEDQRASTGYAIDPAR